MASKRIESFRLGDLRDGINFEGVRRGHRVETQTKHDGAETIFTTLGEYAIQQQPGEQWQLTPAKVWHAAQDRRGNRRPRYRPDWVTAEEMRTRAGEGMFLPDHMDALEKTLLEPYRVCSKDTILTVPRISDLRTLTADHGIPTHEWRPNDLQNLFGAISPGDGQAAENVSLHEVSGELWVATAQTMVNVYHKDAKGQVWRLREQHKRYYDKSGKLSEPVASRQRSSLGETGQLVAGIPERPFDTARRGLYEELGVSEGDVSQLVATGSLLRLKQQGHHRFGPIKAEDHTHYFDAWLDPDIVQTDGYVNTEFDSQQKPRVDISLGWAKI